MNNTTKTRTLAIAAIFIVATLVVGGMLAATTTTTPLAAFAYKNKDGNNNNGSDKINGNGNTDTDTIQKCKQFASGFDPTFGDQNCDILSNSNISEAAVTPQPTTGTLRITKMCSPVDFSTCVLFEFPITVTGNNPVTPSSFSLSHGESQTVTLGPGSFTIHESVPAGFFNPTFQGNCMQIDRSPDATVTISAGQTLSCTIINVPAPV